MLAQIADLCLRAHMSMRPAALMSGTFMSKIGVNSMSDLIVPWLEQFKMQNYL